MKPGGYPCMWLFAPCLTELVARGSWWVFCRARYTRFTANFRFFPGDFLGGQSVWKGTPSEIFRPPPPWGSRWAGSVAISVTICVTFPPPTRHTQRNRMQSLVRGYPLGVSSGSLDWRGDSGLEQSSGSGLRKPQVVRSIRIAGSSFSHGNLRS
jgi:hypothetical protein